MWLLTSETRRPEHVAQPVQRQGQSYKHVMQVKVCAAMELPEPKVPIESQVPDEALDQIGHHPTQKDSTSGVAEST